MKKIRRFLFWFFLFLAWLLSPLQNLWSAETKANPAFLNYEQLEFPLAPDKKFVVNIEKGSLFLLSFKFKDSETPVIDQAQSYLLCDGEKRPFFVSAQIFGIYIPVAYGEERTQISCSMNLVTATSREEIPLLIEVKNKNYIVEKLEVKKHRVVLSKKNLARVAKETAMLKKIYSQSVSTNFFHGPFVAPMQSSITSFFGTKRLYNNIKQSSHMGVDFRSRIGTDVISSNKGKVVFAGNLFFTGNTILIDHGVGIFSIYAHLNKFLVKEGDIVEKNGLIALSGATGRVSGPHLHWAVKIWGHWVDGLNMVELNWPMSSHYRMHIVDVKKAESKDG